MKYLRRAHDELFEYTYQVLVRDKKLIPDRLVPFAVNGGGDFYCDAANAVLTQPAP
jgi:hypothetical protein